MNLKVNLLLLSLALGIAAAPVTALADGSIAVATQATDKTADATTKADNLAAGRYGSVDWYLTASGELHLGAGTLGEDTSLPVQVGQLAAQIATAEDGVTTPTSAQAQAAADQVTKVVLDGTVKTPADASYLFAQLRDVTAYEHLDRLDTSQATTMNGMFQASNVDSVTTDIDVSYFDTANVTAMQFMFYGQKSVENLDVSNFNMDKVTTTTDMFYQTRSLQEVNFAKGSFNSLTSAMYMFLSSGAQVVKLPQFAPAAKFTGGSMFYGTTIITTLTLGPGAHFKGTTSLNTPRQNMPDDFTGVWEAVGNGTIGNPLGAKYATGDDITNLYNGTDNPKSVETYVWEPVNRVIEPTTPPVTPPVTPSENVQPVTVQYLDENGQRLADDVTLTGQLGATYTADQRAFNGYKLVKTVGQANGTFSQQAQMVTFHYAPNVVSGGDAAAIAPMASVVYATKKVGLYKTKNFSKQSLKHWYAKTKRTNRPMFVVTGFATSKKGNLRYKVKDVNHNSKTAGKTGYVTAKHAYVSPVYYASKAKAIKVINAKGINAYQQKSLKTKKNHYKSGQKLKIRKIVKFNKTTRFQLTNGKYVTANKKLVIAE
ncbi:MucBP domain-containing protein [Levilactobacillus parabrevis]|uniref:MucBP domain-containing protein n=1 Tax=Levilactobacillus parabrevis TaxID=357278 RepID=UPI0021A88DE1|nr:MucBP domain-containing protein [Levilactobacillus parabrevis]MCT4488714.1 BspA family leucine-rich repeat surface protein [Levilactobacillus parabrevis]MCT4489772.1 BspA family leucine-rich repeat surface protein [Levilactobacillus parabrevis]